MRFDLLNQEFQRMAEKNTELMGIISEANAESFDYEKHGEAKCKQIAEGVKALEKTMYDTEFFEEVQKIPKGANIKEKVRAYVKAGTEISRKASEYKWSFLAGGGSQAELRVGLFTKMSGSFYYGSEEIRELNEHPNTLNYFLLEKFLQAPGNFLSNFAIGAEFKGKTGTPKHRIESLNTALRKVANRQKLITTATHYGNHEEINGYALKID